MYRSSSSQGMSRSRVLWCAERQTCSGDERKSFDELLEDSSFRPPCASLARLCANSLVIVQEVALTSYLLERHNVALLVEGGQFSAQLGARVDRSSQLICLALFLVVCFSSRAERAPAQKRRTKVRQRLIDGILLACLLRFMSSLLRSLTASYSSDTVASLANGGILLHLFACDYSYANGREPLVAVQGRQRPPFQGGTISLNAVLFSTMLLVSRLRSNASAFFLICVSIVLFAFFPVTRSAISASYPVHSSPVVWIITACVLAATMLIMEGTNKALMLLAAELLIGIMVPCWKYVTQSRKRVLRGSWDIPSAASMHLDYAVHLRKKQD